MASSELAVEAWMQLKARAASKAPLEEKFLKKKKKGK